jgi:hypothetical protein
MTKQTATAAVIDLTTGGATAATGERGPTLLTEAESEMVAAAGGPTSGGTGSSSGGSGTRGDGGHGGGTNFFLR